MRQYHEGTSSGIITIRVCVDERLYPVNTAAIERPLKRLLYVMNLSRTFEKLLAF